jgi:energy-coupling factor transport system ATP-binding protein
MGALTLEDVRYRYPGAGGFALDGVSLDVDEGELVLLAGDSGSGKSSLLRAALGLIPHFHGGELAGRVVTAGMDTRSHRPGEIARRAGLVFQDPESQLVMRRVDREAAFGLENLGVDPAEIPLRAEEALMLTGASSLAGRSTGELSGGEAQRVAVASVLAMGARVLLLDEPTSQLDPVAAEELLGLLVRLNRDRGVTVVVAEHRAGRIFGEADRVVVMEAGRVVVDAAPRLAAAALAPGRAHLLPPVSRAFLAAGRDELPLTVRDARLLAPPRPAGGAPAGPRGADAIALQRVWKRLGDADALRDATAGFATGTITAVVGENGAGKTTLARVACGLADPDRGSVCRAGRAGYVGQNPAHYLIHDSVRDEVAFGPRNVGLHGADLDRRVGETLDRLSLTRLAGRHPKDLSSGEQQRVAIAAVASMQPAALVLDEPTRGLDTRRKEALGELLARLAAAGSAVVLITHDIDFAAEIAGAVTVVARGRVLTDGAPRDLLARGTFVTSQVGLALGCVSIADAAAHLRSAIPRTVDVA